MRIAHVIATLAAEEGGTSRAVVDMALATAARGHDVSILTTDYGGASVDTTEARKNGVKIETLPVRFPRWWKRSPALKATLRRIVPDVDVVHLHSLYLYHCLVTGQICHQCGVPYVVEPHGTLDPFLYRHHRWRKRLIEALFQNRVLDRAAGLHFTAQEELELASPASRGQRGFVFPLPVHLEEFSALPAAKLFHERFPETAGRRIVLFLSRLNFKKGLDLLIPAFGTVAATNEDLHLVLAGPDDGMRADLENWIAKAGLERRVTVTGMLRGDDRLAALAAAEISVLPSYTENFGYAVVEAMACGLPVVISDRVNIWREVEAAEAGVICKPDTAALTEALAAILNEGSQNLVRGANGKALVERLFSPGAVGAQLEEMYETVRSARRHPPG